MAIDDQTSSRLEYLIQQLLDGKLSPEERTQLESLLAAHDYLESQFVQEIEVESALRNLNTSFDVSDRVMQRIRKHLADAEARRAKAAGRSAWRNTAAGAGRHPWRVVGAIALAAAVIAGGFLLFGRHSATGTMTIHEGIQKGRDAQTLVRGGNPINLNGASHVGLARNTNASITCRNGTELELGLEADMTFLGTAQSTDDVRHVRLTNGRLHARIPSLPAGASFAVDTPHGTVTASSAEIEIFVSARATEIRTDAGVAHVERTADHKALDLARAQYIIIREDLDPAARTVMPLRCLFDDQMDPAAFWTSEAGRNAIVPQSSHTGTSALRITPQQGRVTLAGLALPIREHPRSGEFRFVQFAWRKDGGGRIGLQIDHADESQDRRKQGRLYGYRFDAGDGAPVDGLALRTDGKAPQAWWTLTRDLWLDFGDFTVTGLTFICPDGDAAQFDSVYLGQSPADFANIAMVAMQGDGKAPRIMVLNDRPKFGQ